MVSWNKAPDRLILNGSHLKVKGKSTFISGQEELILKRGEFIGSSNGKSRLYLSTDGELKLQYYTPTCGKMSGSGKQEEKNGNMLILVHHLNHMKNR